MGSDSAVELSMWLVPPTEAIDVGTSIGSGTGTKYKRATTRMPESEDGNEIVWCDGTRSGRLRTRSSDVTGLVPVESWTRSSDVTGLVPDERYRCSYTTVPIGTLRLPIGTGSRAWLQVETGPEQYSLGVDHPPTQASTRMGAVLPVSSTGVHLGTELDPARKYSLVDREKDVDSSGTGFRRKWDPD